MLLRAKKWNSSAGASAVEFAIVLPLLVLFLFGIITFGLALNRQQGMEAAAREGARLASVGRGVTFDRVETAVLTSLPALIDPNDVSVRISVNGTPATAKWCTVPQQDLVRVDIEIRSEARSKYALIIPLWPGSGTEPSYAATGTFMCEAAHD